MLKWFRLLGGSGARPARRPDAVLNDGLALAMDWGEHWLAPIQNRLARQHPRLTRAELDETNAVCQAAMRFGQETVHTMVRQGGREVCADTFAAALLERYPWVDAENVARLFRQAVYYACKTGGPAAEP